MPSKSSGSVVLPQKPAALRFYEDGSRHLVVSTYELESELCRKGSFFFLDGSMVVDSLPMSAGVFRFEVLPDGRIIAALTNGCLSMVDPKISSVQDLMVADNRILLDVSIQDCKAITSDDHGSVHIVDLNNGKVQSFQAHTLPFTGEGCEVWSTAWISEHCFVSGGEDALLKVWDCRSNAKESALSAVHSSGVVCLKCEDDLRFLSGSYDEHIRRFDMRMICDSLIEKNLGGGVWAIGYAGNHHLIVSCMYNGWCIIDDNNFDEVESNHSLGDKLLYGASFCSNCSLVASCTFNNYTVTFDKLF
uniref:methylated diphthine methylhydrolase n=1 Tax=Parascaris univalens TaxID=6257 RepID=A0A915ARU8_PARUN